MIQMSTIDVNGLIGQIASNTLPQIIQLVAGMILASQGKAEESAQVLARVGLPTDVNISPEAFMAFVNAQKKVVG
jgi:hypothetical protein